MTKKLQKKHTCSNISDFSKIYEMVEQILNKSKFFYLFLRVAEIPRQLSTENIKRPNKQFVLTALEHFKSSDALPKLLEMLGMFKVHKNKTY